MTDAKAIQVTENPQPTSELMPIKNVEMMVDQVHKLMGSCMKAGLHYGVIPGTERKDKDGKDISKPTLLQAGAELLGMMFRLRPEYVVEKHFHENGHLTIHSKCQLFQIQGGTKVGESDAICSTMESKYAYRNAGRKCPNCSKEAIFKSKEEWGGGYYCNKKSGGCGSKWGKDDAKVKDIEAQTSGKVANEDLADQYNTVIKMANKRAFMSAMKSCTAASDIFTVDLDDAEENKRAGNPTYSTETDITDEVTGLIKSVQKFQNKETKKISYQIAFDSGVVVFAYDDVIALKAKAFATQKEQVTVVYQKKSLQLLTMIQPKKSMSDEELGTAQEPIDAEVQIS